MGATQKCVLFAFCTCNVNNIVLFNLSNKHRIIINQQQDLNGEFFYTVSNHIINYNT